MIRKKVETAVSVAKRCREAEGSKNSLSLP
jgi:hypothetical protein